MRGTHGTRVTSSKRNPRVLVVIGTRPEAIKLAPLLLASEKYWPEAEVMSLATGQHVDLVPNVMAEFGLSTDRSFDPLPARMSLPDQVATLGNRFTQFFNDQSHAIPDLVVVQGDTSSAYCAATAARLRNIPVAHIEAGLRTNCMDAPWPEERFRRAISLFSDFHFAPTELARQNLENEGFDPKRIWCVGNTGIDALMLVRKRSRECASQFGIRWRTVFAKYSRYILVTVHRRENWGRPLDAILRSLREFAFANPKIAVALITHPNPKIQSKVWAAWRNAPKNLIRVDAVPFAEMVYLMEHASLVMTDSGGIQEEAPCMGLRCFILRRNTERPEALGEASQLVGTERRKVLRALNDWVQSNPAPIEPSFLFGDGHASERIVAILRKYFTVSGTERTGTTHDRRLRQSHRTYL